jgi:hypothetical protein
VALEEADTLVNELVDGREDEVADAEDDGVGGRSLISEISVLDKERLNTRTSLIDPTKSSPLLEPPLEPRRRVDEVEEAIK